MKRYKHFGWLMFAALAVTGCRTTGPGSSATSLIVQKVEAAGAGDLDSADSGAIQSWFANHTAVAQSILPQCQSVSKNATANWQNTTEGRVCSTAAVVAWLTPSGQFANHEYPKAHYPKAR